MAPNRDDIEDGVLAERLSRLPDLSQAFRDAPFELKRQTLEAFDLKISYDRAAGHIEISAAISEAVASALKDEKALRAEGLQVTITDIAGARYVPQSDARIVQRYPLAA